MCLVFTTNDYNDDDAGSQAVNFETCIGMCVQNGYTLGWMYGRDGCMNGCMTLDGRWDVVYVCKQHTHSYV